jgi:hypothetical protein
MVVLQGTTQGRQTVIRNSPIARPRQVEPVEASAGIQILRGWTEATLRLLACQILANQVVSGYALSFPIGARALEGDVTSATPM